MRRITATVTLALETESELPLDQIRGHIEDEIGMRLPTIPLPTSEHMGFPWESARVPRAHVERITEQEAPIPFAGDPQTNRTEAYPPIDEQEAP